VARFPTAFGRLLSALDRSLAEPVEVAVVGHPDAEDTRTLLREALGGFHRNRTVAGKAPGMAVEGVPVLEGRDSVEGKATAYVCRGYACRAPTTNAGELSVQLNDGKSELRTPPAR
jgi:uncharacterized protein YyaL (SSP411 family)